MPDIAIKVENISKKYTIGLAQQKHDTLRDLLVDALGLLMGARAPAGLIRSGATSASSCPAPPVRYRRAADAARARIPCSRPVQSELLRVPTDRR